MAAIPESYGLPQGAGMPTAGGTSWEGMLIKDRDDNLFIVIKGVRHLLVSPQLIEESKSAHAPPVRLTDSELRTLPLGGDFTYISRGQKVFFVLLFGLLMASLLSLSNWRGGVTARAIAAVFFIAAIGLRHTHLLQHPRFWAEEGSIWFQYGLNHSILGTLFFVFPISNYISFAANIGAILSSRTAAHIGLIYAPLPTTLFAYLIQALAIISILFIKSRLFDSYGKALFGCAILVFAPTTTSEVWLTSLHSMIFLGFISIVLLFAETDDWSKPMRWAMRATLLFCGLSSPYTVALLPIFFVSAWRTKGREQKLQCLILTGCFLLQSGAVVWSRIAMAKMNTDPVRATAVRPDTSAINIFVEHMTYPALGFSLKERLLEEVGIKAASDAAISLSVPRHPLPESTRAAGLLCFLLIVGVMTLLRGPTLFSNTNMVMAVFLVLSIFVCVTSLYSVPTARYAVLPGVSFLLLLLLNTDASKPRVHRYACMSFLACGLAAGAISYQTTYGQDGPP